MKVMELIDILTAEADPEWAVHVYHTGLDMSSKVEDAVCDEEDCEAVIVTGEALHAEE